MAFNSNIARINRSSALSTSTLNLDPCKHVNFCNALAAFSSGAMPWNQGVVDDRKFLDLLSRVSVGYRPAAPCCARYGNLGRFQAAGAEVALVRILQRDDCPCFNFLDSLHYCSPPGLFMRRVNTIATRRLGGKGKHSGEPSASDRRAAVESPRNQSSRLRRLRQWPIRFHGSTELLPVAARSFRLAAEIRSGALCLGFASEAVTEAQILREGEFVPRITEPTTRFIRKCLADRSTANDAAAAPDFALSANLRTA